MEVFSLPTVGQFTKASVPGVGRFSIFNVGAWFSLLLGLTGILVLMGVASTWAGKAKGVIDTVAGRATGTPSAIQTPGLRTYV